MSPINVKRPESPTIVESPKLEPPQHPQDDEKVPESPRAPRTTEINFEIPSTVSNDFELTVPDYDYSLESIRNFPPIIINIPGIERKRGGFFEVV